MDTDFRIQDFEDGKLIFLTAKRSRVKLLFLFNSGMFLIGAIAFGYLTIFKSSDSYLANIFGIFATVVSLIASFKFIIKATEIEKIFVNQNQFDIIVSNIFTFERESFLLIEISKFKFLEIEKHSPHPLKGESFDYFGFQTEQEVIQDLHKEGRASFVYHNKQIKFGKELVSWEFNHLMSLLFEYTGREFQ